MKPDMGAACCGIFVATPLTGRCECHFTGFTRMHTQRECQPVKTCAIPGQDGLSRLPFTRGEVAGGRVIGRMARGQPECQKAEGCFRKLRAVRGAQRPAVSPATDNRQQTALSVGGRWLNSRRLLSKGISENFSCRDEGRNAAPQIIARL
ncbi:MAG: hypothetical protein JSU77_12360 [Fidelibacterota bacterium]|nr:MAG: hypothetical protein JSU77_12360 [Candidatus Neomarinimicrobiota bacterium]